MEMDIYGKDYNGSDKSDYFFSYLDDENFYFGRMAELESLQLTSEEKGIWQTEGGRATCQENMTFLCNLNR